MPALSFSQAPPNFIVCGDTNPVTVSVAPVAGATSYTWTKPSGWSGSSTSNSITLVPNGTTAGTVSVKANVCGTQTSVLSKVIDMELYSPINTPMVLGPPSLCSSGASYSVNNVPLGASITWSSSPNIALVSPQGSNPATFKATAASSGINSFISVNIATPCGAIVKKKSYIYTSMGYVSNPTIVGSNVVCAGGTWTAQIPAGADAIMWDFDQNNMTLLSGGLNTQSITLQFKTGASTGWVSVKSHSACGWTPYPNYFGIAKSCNYYSYTVSPNPSSSRLIINKAPVVVDELSINKSSITNTPNVYAEIYSLTNSELLKSFALEDEETIVDIQDLKKGMYVLRILEDDEVILTERLIFD